MLQIILILAIILLGLAIGWVVRELNKKWDEYDIRVEAKESERNKERRKIQTFRALWPLVSLRLSETSFTFHKSGLSLTKDYAQLRDITVTRFGYLAFHFKDSGDDFTFASRNPEKLATSLRTHGVQVEGLTEVALKTANFVIYLQFIAFYVPLVVIIDFTNLFGLISDQKSGHHFSIIMSLLFAGQLIGPYLKLREARSTEND